MDLVVISGLSGAGKSTATGILEDMGYYCIDNLPAPLLAAVMKEILKGKDMGEEAQRFALVVDVRSARRFGSLEGALQKLKSDVPNMRLIFFEADKKILLSRYKQSRRNHPLARKQSISKALDEEREILIPIKALATDIIDTSELSSAELRDQLYHLFYEGKKERISILVQSFGFKYGVPLDADSLWDVRFIPNPFYRAELRPLSGLDQGVQDFLWQYPETQAFLDKMIDFYRFSLPFYQREGKVRLNIAIGCTGGRHRSVAVAEALYAALNKLNYEVSISHRDIRRDPQGGL